MSEPIEIREVRTKAALIAIEAHKHQFRRDGVTPYIRHPEAVAGRLLNESDLVIATAWLHDVLEDTQETPKSLRAAGIPETVIDAVRLLTKTDDDYPMYLYRIQAHPIARVVKYADVMCNLLDDPTEDQIKKYAQAIQILSQGAFEPYRFLWEKADTDSLPRHRFLSSILLKNGGPDLWKTGEFDALPKPQTQISEIEHEFLRVHINTIYGLLLAGVPILRIYRPLFDQFRSLALSSN